jgi:ABC-2 type transport system permease protein
MNAVTGAGTLIRLITRRDRVLLAVWAALAVGVPVANAASLTALLPTPQARLDFVAESGANPILHAMLGPILSPEIEAIVAWRSTAQGLLIGALASLLVVVRHTRAEEEAGRRELVVANPVGRHAGLTAVLGVVFATNVLIALLLAIALVAVAGYPVAGSFVLALSFAGVGWYFAAAAGVAAQLARTAAQARSYSIGVLAAALLPVVVAEGGIATWLSPLGWIRGTRAYAGDQWMVLVIPVAVAAVLTATAYGLSARRDVGAGVLADRGHGTGPSSAPPSLRGPLGLAWRLHKDQLVGWGVGLAVFGIALGWGAVGFDELITDIGAIAGWLSAMRADTVGEAFLAILSSDARLVVACVAVMTALRLRTEETSGHVDLLLAGPTSRARWLRSHLVVAFVGPAALLVVLGLSIGLSYGLSSGQPDVVVSQLGAALRFLPAAWFVTAVTVALFGLVPRAVAAVSWGIVVLSIVCVLLWEVQAVDQSVLFVSPFGYSHPAVDAGIAPPVAFTLLSALLTAVGAQSFRRRDISL